MKNQATINRLFSVFTSRQRHQVWWLTAGMVISACMEAASVGLVVPIVSVLMSDDVASRYPAFDVLLNFFAARGVSIVTAGVLLLVAAFLIKSLFLVWMAYKQADFAFNAQAEISERLFSNYLSQPFLFHMQRNSAELIRNAIVETNQFTFGAILPGLVLISEVFILSALMLVLLWYQPVVTVIMTIFGIGFGWLYSRSVRGSVQRWGALRQAHEGLRLQHLNQGLGGVKEVKLSGREDYFLRKFSLHTRESAKTGRLQNTLQATPRLILEFLAVSGLGAIVLIANSNGTSVSSLIPLFALFSVVAFRLIPSLGRIITSLQSIRFSVPILDVLISELSLPSQHSAAPLKLSPVGFKSTIEISNVDFSYPGLNRKIFSGLTLKIKFGQAVGLIGESGAGKSTLLNLILGLFEPELGVIKADGVDIRCNLASWQKKIGYVAQDIYLLDDTLRRNIAFGVPDDEVDEEALRKAVRASLLEGFVAQLPDGLDTVVGENGSRLSGGQRQRIGIARALYYRPALLVMDEATSALDGETEQEVMESVNALHGHTTILIVAHRLSTVANCDVVYRVRNGALEDQTEQVKHATVKS